MMSITPIYNVIIKPQPAAEQGLLFQVPQDKLESFISVLIFNHITSMTVNLEGADGGN